MAITERCIRCRKKVRKDGTCQNQDCVLYVHEKTEEEQSKQEKPTKSKWKS